MTYDQIKFRVKSIICNFEVHIYVDIWNIHGADKIILRLYLYKFFMNTEW